MSRLFGFVINDAQRVACALHPAREALVTASAPEGWGLALYQGGEVLLQRHPKPLVGALDFYRAARDHRTDYLVGQVREPGTPAKLDNTQPFRFRSWVFARSGEVHPGHAALLDKVPDFLRRNIRGQDPTEGLFYLFLSFLHDANRMDDPNMKVTDAATALASALAIADKLVVDAGGQPPAANLVTTNGRILLAVRSGKPLWARQTNGINDCSHCADTTGDGRADRRRVNHEHVRALLLCSEPEKLPEGFEEIPDGMIVGVNRELVKTLTPIRPPA